MASTEADIAFADIAFDETTASAAFDAPITPVDAILLDDFSLNSDNGEDVCEVVEADVDEYDMCSSVGLHRFYTTINNIPREYCWNSNYERALSSSHQQHNL